MLASIDATQAQTDETQAVIKKNLERAFGKEAKKVASHLILGMMLKRKFRQKRHYYLAIRRAKENYDLEERALALELHLQKLLTLEQLPSRQIMELVG